MPRIRDLLGGRHLSHGDLRIDWEPTRVTVTFSNGRAQRIRYREDGDQLVLETTVARPGVVSDAGLGRLAQELLLRNRETEVVTFGLGARDRLEAWVCLHTATLQSEELCHYLAVLAREADRLEYLLTGRDSH